MCKFLGVYCKYSVKTYQEIKVCKLAGSQIISATHKEVNMEKDFLMKNNSVLTQQQIIINTQMYVIFTFIFFFNLIENLKVII